jgi:HAE1 family hydrophobic/amphiphilic exporter-1
MLEIFIRKQTFTWFLLSVLTVSGIFVMFTIPKESTPEIKIPIVGVTTAYPGSSSFDVERLVTEPLENQLLRALRDVDSITSQSSEGISSITINFDSSVDINEALSDVRNEVNIVKSDLPTDSIDPVVQEFSFDDQPIFVVSLSSTEAFTSLNDTVNKIEEMFLDVKNVSKVSISGMPDREIKVILDKNKLSQFGISPNTVSQKIDQSDFSFPAGSIIQNGVEYNITVDNSLVDTDDIRNIIVGSREGGQFIYVKDVAIIEDGLAEYTSLSRLSVNGNRPQQAITFSVNKQVGADITKVTTSLNESLEEIKKDLPNAEFVILIDAGENISTDIKSLSRSALQTILLVVVIMSIGLGIRESLVAGVAVPLSFLLTFMALNFTGYTINFISLFALILSIGLLVDASIVIIEGITNNREKGLSPKNAIRATLKEFAGPVIAGTATTIVVFFPLIFLSGITGQFIKSIPITIIFVLISSLIVALIFVPLLSTVKFGSKFHMKFSDKLSSWREEKINKFSTWYGNSLRKLLVHKKMGKRLMRYLVLLFIVSISLVFTGLIKSEFFPSDQFDQLTIRLELPKSSLLQETDQELQGVEEYLRNANNIESFVSQINSNTASITVILKEKKEGDNTLQSLRDYLLIYETNASISVSPPANGPSSDAPVNLKLSGDNYEDVVSTSLDFERMLRGIPGTTDVKSSVSENVLGIVLTLDREKIIESGLEPVSVASFIRSSIFGSEATTIKRQGDDIRVNVITAINDNYTSSDTTNYVSIDQIRSLPIMTNSGNVPLGVFITESIRGNTPVIDHEDGDRIVSVSSALETGVILSDVSGNLREQISNYEIPDGVTWSFGGDVEESAESGIQLLIALLVGIMLVIGVLVYEFNSIRKMLFIVSVIPFGLVGVLLGLFIFNQTLSFTSMIGFVALVGIVVNNSIILIDVLGGLQKEDDEELDHLELVIKGASSRLRPILLTTATTAMGMLPLLFTSPVWRPLALAIISGLMFAVILTLVMIPLMYYWWGKKK